MSEPITPTEVLKMLTRLASQRAEGDYLRDLLYAAAALVHEQDIIITRLTLQLALEQL